MEIFGPIEVIVTETEWFAIAEPTPANKYVYALLEAAGGISDGVTPGCYQLRIIIDEPLIYSDLSPSE